MSTGSWQPQGEGRLYASPFGVPGLCQDGTVEPHLAHPLTSISMLTGAPLPMQADCPVFSEGEDQHTVLQAAAMATKWWEPARDALDTMVLNAARMHELDGYQHTDFTPFDPSVKVIPYPCTQIAVADSTKSARTSVLLRQAFMSQASLHHFFLMVCLDHCACTSAHVYSHVLQPIQGHLVMSAEN